MAIVSDTKDWTWVLDRPCAECGLDTNAIAAQDVSAMLRLNATVWRAELLRNDVRDRPNPSTWSPLEYGCHVRDVCRRFDARLTMMLTQDDPEFENWDQDATAVAERYDTQDPEVVAVELVDAAHTLAGRFEAVRGPQWERTGRRSDGAHFTVGSFARYFVHDLVHHLHDVGVRER